MWANVVTFVVKIELKPAAVASCGSPECLVTMATVVLEIVVAVVTVDGIVVDVANAAALTPTPAAAMEATVSPMSVAIEQTLVSMLAK